ncbi:MAG: anti-sigma factor [Pseudomonadota bacterium]|nr:anti-sigma factor [Pseudomonadota bacterium]
MIDDEEFFAWLDGELDDEAAARVAAVVAADPELAAKADQHRQLAAEMRGAFSPVIEGSGSPPRFEAAEVIDFGAKASERVRRQSWLGVRQLAAMAASLALGLAIGIQFVGRADSPIAVQGGRLVAAAGLDLALDTQLASAPGADMTRIGLTFRDAGGRICRSFSDASASGLACREGDSWHIQGLYPTAEGQRGNYRMAAGAEPRLASLIDETIKGDPFDAAQERAARQQGWR